jgi:uncharacterized protein DUF6455
MVLIARKGRRAGGLGRIPAECDLGLRFWQSGSDERSRRTVAIVIITGVRRREIMTALAPEYSTHIYEMMARLGIEPGAGVLPQLSLRYATALRRCENCRSKKACQDWLDYAPAMVNFAPDFCMNADILFELQSDQAGPRRVN